MTNETKLKILANHNIQTSEVKTWLGTQIFAKEEFCDGSFLWVEVTNWGRDQIGEWLGY